MIIRALNRSTVSVYVGHLGSDKYGSVLKKTRERYYQFADSVFKAYAAARPFELKPGDQEDAVGPANDAVELFEVVRLETEVHQTDSDRVGTQHPNKLCQRLLFISEIPSTFTEHSAHRTG